MAYPESPLAVSIEAMRNTLAYSTTFQQLVGVQTPGDALAKVYLLIAPLPTDDAYTIAELDAMRPFGSVGLITDQALRGQLEALGDRGEYSEGGAFAVNIEYNIDPQIAGDLNAVNQQALDTFGKIDRDMRNLGHTVQGTVSMLAFTDIALLGFLRAHRDQSGASGDYMAGMWRIAWQRGRSSGGAAT